MERRTFLKGALVVLHSPKLLDMLRPQKLEELEILPEPIDEFLSGTWKPKKMFIACFNGDERVSEWQEISFSPAIDCSARNLNRIRFDTVKEKCRVDRLIIGDKENEIASASLETYKNVRSGDYAVIDEGNICITL